MDTKTTRTARTGPPKSKEQLRLYIPHIINRISNRWNIDQNCDLAEFGINNVVLRALSVLFIYKTLTVNEIAVLAVTEQSTASRTIDTMVASGWVKREVAEEDMRRRVVALTKEGELLLGKAWPIIEQNYAALTRGISPEDIATCARVLSSMIDNIRQNDI